MTQPNTKKQIIQLTTECQKLLARIKKETLIESEKTELVQKLEDTAHQLLPLLKDHPDETARTLVVGILKQRLARLESLSDNAMLAVDKKMSMLNTIVADLEKKSRSKIN